jgi:DNA polymerase-3 subunit gamma/tau
LQVVVDAEGLDAERPALEEIARHATGSLRDALGLLDQLSVYQEERGDSGNQIVTVDAVRTLLGISRNDRIVALVHAIADRDPKTALEVVNEAVDAGEDARQLNRQLVAFVRELLFARAGANRGHDETTRTLAERFSLHELSDLAKRFSEVDFKIKRSLYGQLPLEIALVDAVSRGTATANIAGPRSVEAPTDSPSPGLAAPSPKREAPADLPATTRLAERIRKSPTTQPVQRPQVKNDEPITFAPPPGIVRTDESAPNPAEPPARVEPSRQAAVRAQPGSAEALTVDRLAELWTQIRLDVKAVDRRVEALLAASDPYDVAGDEVLLVTPYDFHARKLNEDSARNIVSEVVERVFGRDHLVVVTYQVGNTPPRRSASTEPSAERHVSPQVETVAPPAEAPVTEPRETEEATVDPQAILGERTRAAMAIFDAVPVDESSDDDPR